MGTAYEDFMDTRFTSMYITQDGNCILKDGATSVTLVTVPTWVAYDKYVYVILGLSTVSLDMDVTV